MKWWPFKSKPKPWVYANHRYDGVVEGNHVYTVLFKQGTTPRTEVYKFHARRPDHGKSDEQLAIYFQYLAGTLKDLAK